MSIYIAHRLRKTSNALDTLVLSEQECFQWTSERLVTTRRIAEVSWQLIPSRWSSDSEGPTTKWAELVTQHNKLFILHHFIVNNQHIFLMCISQSATTQWRHGWRHGSGVRTSAVDWSSQCLAVLPSTQEEKRSYKSIFPEFCCRSFRTILILLLLLLFPPRQRLCDRSICHSVVYIENCENYKRDGRQTDGSCHKANAAFP